MSIPFNISDNSIFFFAKGRPFNIARDNPNFQQIKDVLCDGTYVIDDLIDLCDVKATLSKQGLVVDGDQITYNGDVLHNVWVDKILTFLDQGNDATPVLEGLKNLMENPTPAAIERLPIFVERSQLGFMADGRIAAYKAVRDDYYDIHSGSVHYAIGSTVEMDRAACNDDPNRTCSTGLHVGAIDYVKEFGYGWGQNRRLLLCAFWPKDAVSVPTDYQGGKMRVCRLDVIEEVDRAYVDQHLGFNRGLVGYVAPTTTPVKAPHEVAEEGMFIRLGEGSVVAPGVYEVEKVNRDRVDTQVKVEGFYVFNRLIEAVARTSTAAKAKIGDLVRVTNSDYVEDDILKVVSVNDDGKGYRITVEFDDPWTGTEISFVEDDSVGSVFHKSA